MAQEVPGTREHEDRVPSPEPLEELGMATHTHDPSAGATETGSLRLTDSHPSLLCGPQVPVRVPGSNKPKQSGPLLRKDLRLTSGSHTYVYTYMNVHLHSIHKHTWTPIPSHRLTGTALQQP